MRTIVRINGRTFSRCATHTSARCWADALYQAMADLVTTGFTDNHFLAEAISKFASPDEEFVITVNGENWERFIPEQEWIRNLEHCEAI